MNVRPCLPGSLLLSHQPSQALQDPLQTVKSKTTRKAVQTKINKPNPTVEEPPLDVTHVYARHHKQIGLDPPYFGPFKIIKRLSRSTVRIKVGTYADGSTRTEDRFWGDLKAVKLSDNVIEEQRPKLGRKPKKPSETPQPVQTSGPPPSQPFTNNKPSPVDTQYETLTGKKPHPGYLEKGPLITTEMFNKFTPDIFEELRRPVRSTRNPNPQYVDIAAIDFSIPPPPLPQSAWTASPEDLQVINASIRGP